MRGPLVSSWKDSGCAANLICWATFLVDAYSRRLFAVYLTFDAPSYRSCMMAVRICVRRYSRLPQT